MIGLPGTGKTTFLAALWHVVTQGKILGALRLVGLPRIRDHLNKICSDWVACRSIDRTSIGAEKTVSMKLENPASGNVVEAFFPDLSGETFVNHLKDRQWTIEYYNLVRDAKGIMLFIHPGKVQAPVRIDQAEKFIKELDQEEEVKEELDYAQMPWSIHKAPTQVKLVELLQFHLNHQELENIFRIAVIISAWDLVMKDNESAEKWLGKYLPLLYQYLRAQKGRISSRIYGVSAQGGDFGNAVELLKKFDPEERIIITGEDSIPHDITGPIKWLVS
jgi:hypothetical protein